MSGPSLKIKMRSDLEGLAEAAKSIEAFAEREGVGSRAAYVVGLAFEEMATNIIKYGFEDASSNHEVDVALSLSNGFIVLTLEDEGREFDPLSVSEPETAASVEDREIGGLGVHLVKRMADSMAYRREGVRNILDIKVKNTP